MFKINSDLLRTDTKTLKEIETNVDNLQPVVLFEGTGDGATGDITFNQSIKGFRYIEIHTRLKVNLSGSDYYRVQPIRRFEVSVTYGNWNQYIELPAVANLSGWNLAYHGYCAKLLSDTKLSNLASYPQGVISFDYNSKTWKEIGRTNTYLYITKIVGYKN